MKYLKSIITFSQPPPPPNACAHACTHTHTHTHTHTWKFKAPERGSTYVTCPESSSSSSSFLLLHDDYDHHHMVPQPEGVPLTSVSVLSFYSPVSNTCLSHIIIQNISPSYFGSWCPSFSFWVIICNSFWYFTITHSDHMFCLPKLHYYLTVKTKYSNLWLV